MISNQILQSTLDGLKDITRAEMCICDIEGKLVATTFPEASQYEDIAKTFISSPAESQLISGFQFFKVLDDRQLEYVLMVQGDAEDSFMLGKMVSFQVQSLLVAYKERFDKSNFIKNLLLDNLLLVDIYNRAKKLHIDTRTSRVIYIVENKNPENGYILEPLKALFADDEKKFVTAVDEKDVIIVQDVYDHASIEELEAIANEIMRTIKDVNIKHIGIAYGTVVAEIKELSKSYKEAKMALEVGKIFYEESDIVAYSKLGIGRLIYQLPMPLCRMFIKEIFDGKSPDDFDEETVDTINKFFENSLNVSETARQLYIHRNTLVYRLDKLQKTSGLDLRVFDDAITFKIALMVVKYMNHMEKTDF